MSKIQSNATIERKPELNANPEIDDSSTLVSRREFTVESVLALLAGVTITITGCGGSTESPTSPSPSGDVNGSISANHGHVATVTGAQITSAGAVSLDIRGQADHPHTVDLSADEIARIGARTQVAKSSTTDAGHSHIVTFN